MRALLTTCLAAAAAMGVAAPADAATYSVSYVVNSNEPTATVQFDDKVQTMRLGWSDMDSTYTASKVFKTTRPMIQPDQKSLMACLRRPASAAAQARRSHRRGGGSTPRPRRR